MNTTVDCDDQDWPPGTVRIENFLRRNEVILQPRPTSDPNDPLNWANWRKYLNFALACMYAIFVWTDINIVTVTWGAMQDGDDLKNGGFSYDILNDSYASGCAALAIGSPLLIPFALKYGRRPIYILSTLAQFIIAIWDAKLQNVGDLIAVNTLNCFFGSLAEVIVQMTVADVFFVHERGRMNSLYFWALSVGNLANIAGGYIVDSQGWRWVWWWMAIFFGANFFVYCFMFEESKFTNTHDGVDSLLLQDPLPLDDPSSNKGPLPDAKNAETAVIVGEGSTLHGSQIDHTIPLKSYRSRLALWQTSAGSFRSFARHGYQPLMCFATIPAVFYICLVYAIVDATVTIQITIISEYFYDPPWNFSASAVGLMAIPAFIGSSIGLVICGPVSDWTILHLAKRNQGIYEPEMRLWVIAVFVPFLTAGLFIFGYGFANGLSWEVLAVASGLISAGSAPANSITVTYLTDSYTGIVADFMVAITITRNIISTIFVFALSAWLDGMGVKNMFIMLAVLNTVIIGSVLLFIYYGKQLRIKTAKRYWYYAGRQIDSRET